MNNKGLSIFQKKSNAQKNPLVESPAKADILFSRVSKDFLIGRFSDVLKTILGIPCLCPRVRALDGVSFGVRPGHLVGILGRNGAGKSTLLRVAGGIYQEDEGTVFVKGSPTAIFEMGILGNQHLTGRAFSDFYFTFRNMPKPRREELIEDVQEFAELEGYFDEPIITYSSGMLARLFFAVVTAIPGRIVLIDEILSVGDEYFQGKSFKRLVKMISKGSSGILATHDWFNAIRLCSRILVLDRGKVEFDGSPLEAIRRYLKPVIPPSTCRVYFLNKDQLASRTLNYRCGDPLKISFTVESTMEDDFALGVAVEIPKLSMIALLSNDNVVSGGIGRHEISLEFPAFPVCYSECYLSLFLTKPRVQKRGAVEEIYDQVSWTTGASIRMMNEEAVLSGDEAVFYRPLGWHRS
jgi:lipopolysaccharide transport system ATP-binding protein